MSENDAAKISEYLDELVTEKPVSALSGEVLVWQQVLVQLRDTCYYCVKSGDNWNCTKVDCLQRNSKREQVS